MGGLHKNFSTRPNEGLPSEAVQATAGGDTRVVARYFAILRPWGLPHQARNFLSALIR